MFKHNYKQNRRGFLASVSVAASVGLAGCFDDERDDGEQKTPSDLDGNQTTTETNTGIGNDNVTDTSKNETSDGNETDDENKSDDK